MAQGTNKAIDPPLPTDFWDVVEDNLPGYSDRLDVEECNSLAYRMNSDHPLTAEEKKRLRSLDRALYEEALIACAGKPKFE